MQASLDSRSRYVFVLSLLFMMFSVSIFAANADDERGRYYSNPNANIDGTQVLITPDSFGPASGRCMIFSTLIVYDNAVEVVSQLEAGGVRCNNRPQGLDNECPTGKDFVEKSYPGPQGDIYECTTMGNLGQGATNYNIRRISNSSDIFQAYVGGVAGPRLSGFPVSDPGVYSQVWGEQSPSASCSAGGPTSADFASWKKYDYGSGSTIPTGAKLEDPCWTVGTLSGTGAFHVSR